MNFFYQELPQEELQPPITVLFSQFLEGKYADTRHNLYIIWRFKQALYVGIAKDNIWMRWFRRSSQSHMRFIQKYSGTLEGGYWIGETLIGQIVARNLPKSLDWRVEFRHYSTRSFADERLEKAEQRLIRELRPLFNGTYRGQLTKKEQKLSDYLSGLA